jgi:hypothetical protein
LAGGGTIGDVGGAAGGGAARGGAAAGADGSVILGMAPRPVGGFVNGDGGIVVVDGATEFDC